jgi:hypothetical protein
MSPGYVCGHYLIAGLLPSSLQCRSTQLYGGNRHFTGEEGKLKFNELQENLRTKQRKNLPRSVLWKLSERKPKIKLFTWSGVSGLR